MKTAEEIMNLTDDQYKAIGKWLVTELVYKQADSRLVEWEDEEPGEERVFIDMEYSDEHHCAFVYDCLSAIKDVCTEDNHFDCE